jgi:hypothetical protein
MNTEALQQYGQVAEAIASVALSHEPSCKCLTCRAAQGDEDSFTEIYMILTERAADAATSDPV